MSFLGSFLLLLHGIHWSTTDVATIQDEAIKTARPGSLDRHAGVKTTK